MAGQLILARHGDTGSRYASCYLGSTDVPLSDEGHRQAEAMGSLLASCQPDHLMVSPMLRARQTAEPASLAYKLEENLREVDFGRWEGCRFDQISSSITAEELDRWACFDMEFNFPDGENLGQYVQRVIEATDRLVQMDGETVFVIAHGGGIRTMLCHLLGLPHARMMAFRIDYASLTTVNISDGIGSLVRHNDTHYLEAI